MDTDLWFQVLYSHAELKKPVGLRLCNMKTNGTFLSGNPANGGQWMD